MNAKNDVCVCVTTVNIGGNIDRRQHMYGTFKTCVLGLKSAIGEQIHATILRDTRIQPGSTVA